ncbi:hypothetical protein RRG08_031316 [Elysia crispata]|uniref:Uncharacterized protein n=1 Tax=Elysia crispata TaxID=231223 RepID=A0AAE1CZX0_9GAST|nr:hypothetical protein RRG08_031316 [Elysia crispata]
MATRQPVHQESVITNANHVTQTFYATSSHIYLSAREDLCSSSFYIILKYLVMALTLFPTSQALRNLLSSLRLNMDLWSPSRDSNSFKLTFYVFYVNGFKIEGYNQENVLKLFSPAFLMSCIELRLVRYRIKQAVKPTAVTEQL